MTNRQHGGQRDNRKRRPDDQRGGSRNGAGRYKQNIRISLDAARSLRVLMLRARSARERPELTEDELVEELIEAAWREYDQGIQVAVDEVCEGGVL